MRVCAFTRHVNVCVCEGHVHVCACKPHMHACVPVPEPNTYVHTQDKFSQHDDVEADLWHKLSGQNATDKIDQLPLQHRKHIQKLREKIEARCESGWMCVRVCMYMCVCKYIYLCVCIYIYIHTYVRT
jgi:hypothetical protein